MEILRDRKAQTMTITHRKNITDLLSAISMQGCTTSPTPLVPKEKLKIWTRMGLVWLSGNTCDAVFMLLGVVPLAN